MPKWCMCLSEIVLSSRHREIVLLTLLMVAFTTAICAQSFTPNFKPQMSISPRAGTISVDGRLDESAWSGAAQVTNFCERQPGDKTQPPVETKALVTYDNNQLYVAFICHDDPSTIRASMTQRDQFGGNDAVVVFLDTYGEAAWAYELFVNAYGVQKDALWTGVGAGAHQQEDTGFDLIWESAAAVTDSGYQVEMAIPFSSLRFPEKAVQQWRVDFWRIHPREAYRQYSWAAYDRNEQCWVCQWGSLDGISNVSPGRGLALMPSVVTHQTGELSEFRNPNSGFDNRKIDGEFSVGAKYSISSSVVAEGSYNPDFSQIESDVAQIDVNSTISLFYPERRPFFQEGSDIFRTLFNSFYTRMINDPQFAAKLTARSGKLTLGALSARDENSPYMIPLEEASVLLNTGKSVANVVRGTRTIGNGSHLGLFLADRRFETGDGSSSIAALDANIRLTNNYSIDGQWILTHTAEPDDSLTTHFFGNATFDYGRHTMAFDGENYYGSGMITRLRRSARSWNFTIDYNQVTPAYRTQIGFDPYADYRNASIGTSYVFYTNRKWLDRLVPNTFEFRRWNFDGVLKTQQHFFGIDAETRVAQTNFGIGYSNQAEKFAGVEFNHLWRVNVYFNSTPFDWLLLYASASQGEGIARFAVEKGQETYINVGATLKPVDQLNIQPYFDYAHSDDAETDAEFFKGYIARTRFQYQFNRELSARLVVQYDDFERRWEVDPLLTYRLSPFSVFYAGSTYNYDELRAGPNDPRRWTLSSRQFFMKLQYLFQS